MYCYVQLEKVDKVSNHPALVSMEKLTLTRKSKSTWVN